MLIITKKIYLVQYFFDFFDNFLTYVKKAYFLCNKTLAKSIKKVYNMNKYTLEE